MAGIAPDARLLALRACWEQPGSAASVCSSFTLAKALQFALQTKVQVINLSLSGPPDRLFMASAGCRDERRCHRGWSARSMRGQRMAASRRAMMACWPLRGAHPENDLGNATGRVGTGEGGFPLPQPGGGWSLVSGPSFAAAQVTGLVALLRELSPGLQVGRSGETRCAGTGDLS